MARYKLVGGHSTESKSFWSVHRNTSRSPYYQLIMSLATVMDHIKERLTKVDPNNRKVVAIFQIKAGDVNWGESHQ